MAGLRPGRAIRDSDKVAWTRYSKRKPRKSFIKAMPHGNLHQYRMGAMKDDFDLVVHLQSLEPIIIRDNSMESARQTSNKLLESKMAGNYYFIVRVYPHHIIRENKMIAGAGADRLQKGMRRAFGRPSNRAARLSVGTSLFTVHTHKANLAHVKAALERAKRKISGSYRIVVEEKD
uniref:50S ribosomal protein L10e n=1 Tax=Candidatus Methanophaga sp. ANME-1 ERB7 TaxID=2759913 RepID=A0A7G9Z2F4_9EURY|nr:50S ribosomal protein L10e [Methanosarcinales archaeon ANME-1 ERB7]